MCSRSTKALEVRGLSKMYRVARATASRWGRTQVEPFWALKDVSLRIGAGELVGIIGRNGAGKSTLLKVLTRVTPPTSGEVDVYGRVGSLLEVGTGFHPELTGRENIYLNGAILGMRRHEITSEFDAIVAFAGVERFLETPVKRYSSGMYVRLAFAVAAHLRSEILLVDEVLAVGDLEFQKRCLGKIQGVALSGRTVVFVSHHLESVSALCQRAIVMEGGSVAFDGPVPLAVERYLASFQKAAGRTLAQYDQRSGSGEIRVIEATLSRGLYEPAERKQLQLRLKQVSFWGGPFYLSVHVTDASGATVVQCDSRLVGKWFRIEEPGEVEVRFSFRTPWLKPGTYGIDIFVCGTGILDRCLQACVLEVSPCLPYPQSASSDATAHGVVFADFAYTQIEGSAESESRNLSEASAEGY